MSIRVKILTSVTTMLFAMLTGCNTAKVTVSRLDRAYLADYLMNEKRDKLGVKMFDHAYFSREASRGGGRVGGGGCGCN